MLEVFKNGGPVMYPLLACSVIALTVIIDRVIFWVKLEVNRNATLVDEILEIGYSGSRDAIKAKTSGSKDYIIRILNQGVLNSILDRATITSVKAWQFEPGKRRDQPVDMWVRIPVRFQLKQNDF